MIFNSFQVLNSSKLSSRGAYVIVGDGLERVLWIYAEAFDKARARHIDRFLSSYK